MHFYQLKTGAIWASNKPLTKFNKLKLLVGNCYKVKSLTASPEMDTEYEVVFGTKQLACMWRKTEPEVEDGQFNELYAKMQAVEQAEEEGQLFAKKNPNLHPKDKKKKNGKV